MQFHMCHKNLNMLRLTLILFIVIKLQAFCASDMYKIIKTHLNRNDWHLLEEEEQHNGLDIFSQQKAPDGKFDVVFKARSNAINVLENNSIPHTILSDDSKSLFQVNGERQLRQSEGLVNDTITFMDFLKLEEIMSYLEILPGRTNADKTISIESIGKTIENRDIMMVKIVHPYARDTIFIDGGIHAREWLAVMQALYLIEQVVQADSNSNLTHVNWYIVPNLNPDGYVQSVVKFRLQRKNMNKKNCPPKCETCGVDLNRNFGYQFGVSGTSTDPCSQIYRGEYAFSEPESRALRDVLDKYAQHILLYLTFHTYGQLILFPWGYAAIKCDDWQDLQTAGLIAKDAIANNSQTDTVYTVVNTGESCLDPAAGGSDDYAKSLGIKYSYTMELQGGGSSGFDPPTTTIKAYVEENFAGISAMVGYIHKPYNYTKRGNNAATIFTMKLFPGIIIYSVRFHVLNVGLNCILYLH